MAGINIQGILYGDEGTTAITTADKVVRLYVNGSDTGLTDTTDGTGAYTFTFAVNAGDPILV